jgi:hypothetical protein
VGAFESFSQTRILVLPAEAGASEDFEALGVLAGGADWRLVGEDSPAWDHHVAFQGEDGFEDVVRGDEGDAGVLRHAGRPTGEEIFIVEEPAAIVESGAFGVGVVFGDDDFSAPGGGAAGPGIERVDAERAAVLITGLAGGKARTEKIRTHGTVK